MRARNSVGSIGRCAFLVIIAWPAVKQHRVSPITGAAKKRNQRAAVRPIGSGNTRKFANRRRKVDHSNQRVFDSRAGYERRISQRKGQSAGFFVNVILAGEAVLAPEVSVVRVEHDESVVELALLSKLVQDVAHALVDRLQRSQLLQSKFIDGLDIRLSHLRDGL